MSTTDTPPPSPNPKSEISGPRVDARPYAWPYDGYIVPERTALILIDWQHDFCAADGYVSRMGYDVGRLYRAVAPTKRMLQSARAAGMHIIHTREGHRADLSDLPATKRWRSRQIGAEIGAEGPLGRRLVRNEPGWEIIPELAPKPGEPIVDKPGKGSFYATDLDTLLRRKGVTHLVLTGVTTDVCVHTTMREANDRGYECLLLEDCTAAVDEQNERAALKMVTMSGGVFGAVASSTALQKAMLPTP